MTMFANSFLRDTQATIRQSASERGVTPRRLIQQGGAKNLLVSVVKAFQDCSDSARSDVLRWVHVLKHQPWSCQ